MTVQPIDLAAMITGDSFIVDDAHELVMDCLQILEHIRFIAAAMAGDGYDEDRVEFFVGEVLRLTGGDS